MGALNIFYSADRALTNDRQLSHERSPVGRYAIFLKLIYAVSGESNSSSRIASPFVERLFAPGSSDCKRA
ncbi:hypothetical protein H6F71_13185 [Microcoleus sp. FACHB-61]|nr:hypothetical protein [Microcoleus sp. FACHB-61]